MSVSPELIFELLLKVPNHSELFLFELKSKFDRFKRDVIDEIRTQELIHNFWKFIIQTIELCLPANYITVQINKKALELTAELTMAKVHINDYQQHAKASKHMEQASIIVSEIMILLIENITSSTNSKAMMAVVTIPSVLGIDAPITLQELKEKMKGLKTKCLDEAITKERAAYDFIKSPSKKAATGIYFCGEYINEPIFWAIN